MKDVTLFSESEIKRWTNAASLWIGEFFKS